MQWKFRGGGSKFGGGALKRQGLIPPPAGVLEVYSRKNEEHGEEEIRARVRGRKKGGGETSDFAVKLLGLPVDQVQAQCHKSGFSLLNTARQNGGGGLD